jgi:hypothetical protein
LALAACGPSFTPQTSPSPSSSTAVGHGYVFVTSGVFFGNQFATGDGDKQCQSVAARTTRPGTTPFGSEAPRTSTKWVAWLSYYDSMYDPGKLGGALVRLKQHLGYRVEDDPLISWYDSRWDGASAPLFSNFTAIPSGPRQGTGGVRYDENGTDVTTATPKTTRDVWTATGSTGELTVPAQTCLETVLDAKQMVVSSRSWASSVGVGLVGALDKDGADWTFSNRTLNCTEQAHLYCFGLVQ